MTTTQDFTQVEQLAAFSGFPLAQDLMNNRLFQTEESSSISAPSTTPAPESTEEVREPLREISEVSASNNEEQEQSEQSAEKLNEYVSKVLEKLLQQKDSIAKLGSILDSKSVKNGQIEELIRSFDANESASTDESSEDSDDCSKENLSPVNSKQVSSKLEFAAATSPERILASVPSQKVVPQFNLEDVLEISRKTINFGTRFPGQIVEEHLDIVNKSKHDFVVQIHVNCLNEELDNSDEYVFSVRRTHLYDYNDKHYLIMAPYSSASFKFALKVPNMKIVGGIQGEVKIGIQGQEDCHTIELSGAVTIPKVFCPKELSCRGLDYKVTKLAVKEGKKQDFKIPLRNNGDVPVTLELEFYEPQDQVQKKDRFDMLVHPNVITINPNSVAIANILVKPHKNATGLKDKPSRKILTARVRDSALVYSFVFWIEFY